jgi:hypothetical protein
MASGQPASDAGAANVPGWVHTRNVWDVYRSMAVWLSQNGRLKAGECTDIRPAGLEAEFSDGLSGVNQRILV